MRKYVQGKYIPINPRKYRGDPTNIVFRSSWEKRLCYWLDRNPDVLAWSSEEIVIPYICPTDNKLHRYFLDFWIQTTKGTFLVEIKPQSQCLPPKTGGRRKQHVVESEAMTYMKNQAKWRAAEQYASERGYRFYVWDEVTLKSLGVMV